MKQIEPFWRTHVGIPVMLVVALWSWTELSELDLRFSQWIFAIGGNQFFDNWFLNDVMHGGVRAVGYTMAYALMLALVASLAVPRLAKFRRPLIFVVASVALSSMAVVQLKHLTNVYCPMQLTVFGGDKPLLSPFDIQNWTGINDGQCWPGGHSSYGFAMWAFYFAARELRRPAAPWILALVFIYGNVLGSVRVIQGAHFISHQWWTAAVSWFITVAFYVLLLRRDLLRRDLLPVAARRNTPTVAPNL